MQLHGLDGEFAQIHGQGGRTVGAAPLNQKWPFSFGLSYLGNTLHITDQRLMSTIR